MRDKAVHVGLPNAEQMRLFGVFLGEPPAVRRRHDVAADDRGELGDFVRYAPGVLDGDFVAVLDAELRCGSGVS